MGHARGLSAALDKYTGFLRPTTSRWMQTRNDIVSVGQLDRESNVFECADVLPVVMPSGYLDREEWHQSVSAIELRVTCIRESTRVTK